MNEIIDGFKKYTNFLAEIQSNLVVPKEDGEIGPKEYLNICVVLLL